MDLNPEALLTTALAYQAGAICSMELLFSQPGIEMNGCGFCLVLVLQGLLTGWPKTDLTVRGMGNYLHPT
eukprot:13973593-Ditylum_brightwellii.AAC.1